MKCASCGTENHEEARFCKSCGAPLTPAPAPTTAAPVPPTPPPPPPYYVPRRRRYPHEDLLGLLGFAFVLLALAVVLSLNPNLIGDFIRWTDSMATSHTFFVRPPERLIVSAAWFFGIVGVLEFVSAFLRWAARWPKIRAVSRILTGIGDLIFALLLLRYADRAISGPFLITVLVGVFAALLMVYVTLGVYWSEERPFSWISAPQPPARQ